MPLLHLLASATLTVAPVPAAQHVNQVDTAIREGHSQVLVLGTSHLSSLPEGFDPHRFDPLLDKLAAWNPEMILIEALGGAQCDYLRAFTHAYPDQASNYCPDPAAARAALKLDQAGAEKEIEERLAQAAADRPAAERRRLIVLFLAAGDPASAMVQWLRLPEADRKPEGELSADLAKALAPRKRLNENTVIAAALAARLGLERVYPVDDHTGDRATGKTDPAFEQRLGAIWQGTPAAGDAFKTLGGIEESFVKGGGVLDYYRAVNGPIYQDIAVRFDFGAAAADTGEGLVGRRYLAFWETRNLRMVANIREAIGPRPGLRALAVVGASHKPYYERYLGMTSEVKLAEVDAVLK